MKCDLCENTAVGAMWSPDDGWVNACWVHMREGVLRDYDAVVGSADV